ncbi:hypothetical protein CEXT_777501 [Caerostris extrusa]|uniref:Uncharacterized protein n=1 Tax=Caerostris extrusa TaxID=172846 RepID=A0AAV4YC58_CAEEX|nr:hypothetical protein CEXT_777501 [Caerostris extrusa]
MVSNFELIDICSESDGDTSEDENCLLKMLVVKINVEKQEKANKTTETKKIDDGNQNLMGIFEDSESIECGSRRS